MDELLGKLAQIEASFGRSSVSNNNNQEDSALSAWETLLHSLHDQRSSVETADLCTQAWRVLISFYARQSTPQMDRKRILLTIRSVLPKSHDELQLYHSRLVPGGLSDLLRRLESCLSIIAPAATSSRLEPIPPPKKLLKVDKVDPSSTLHWLYVRLSI
jgi:hypothetical protein